MRYLQTPIANRSSSARRGFTLIECLLSLAITAVLMAAVATAFNASAISYKENEEMFWAINGARQAMERMVSQLRTAGYVDANGVVYGVPHQSAGSSSCLLYTPTGSIVRFEFRGTDKKLYLIQGNTSTSPEYVLCDGVTAASFTTTSKNGVDATGVQILLTVQSGGASRTLSGAAVIRRALGT
ncbi:MAG: PilW family protein [Solirubrobacterales bacterium]